MRAHRFATHLSKTSRLNSTAPEMQMNRSVLAAICFLLVISAPLRCHAQKEVTAVEEFRRLRERANAARTSGDKQAHLKAVLGLVSLLNEAPDAVVAAAKAYAEVGDTEHATAALAEFADQGQVDESLLRGKSGNFAAMEKSAQYQTILSRFKENKLMITLGKSVFELSDPGLLAEDIDYDPGSKTFLATSVLEKKIVRVSEGKVKDFAFSPSHWPILGLKVDAARGLVWATEVALEHFKSVPNSDWGRSALLCFNLPSGQLVRRIEAAGKTALGDLVLTPDGTAIVSDSLNGGVYRVAGDRLELLNGTDFISPQTPAMHPDGRHLFVPDYARGIGLLDLSTRKVRWLDQGSKHTHALNGIDGLYFDRGFLIATQNGSSPERVIRFRLNADFTGVDSEQVIERATASLGDPTHGVVVGEYFYYIANSGWDVLSDEGEVKSGAKLTSARVMRFRISGPQ